jgi:hypothetical protein
MAREVENKTQNQFQQSIVVPLFVSSRSDVFSTFRLRVPTFRGVLVKVGTALSRLCPPYCIV